MKNVNCSVSRSLMLAIALVGALAGCAAQVGSSVKQGFSDVEGRNTSPTAIQLVDGKGTLTGHGTGPGAYTSLKTGDAELETNAVGTAKQDAVFDLYQGRGALSSATNFTAKNVEITLNDTGQVQSLKIGSFGTNSSDPTRAANEAYDRLAAAWTAVPPASQAVIIEQVKAIEATAPGLAELILRALGVP